MDNNNKPVKAPGGVPSKWGNLLYIIVPVLLIAVIASFMGTQNKKEAPKYFEIVEQFRNAEITEYSLNLSSGALEYKVKGSDEELEYVVPNVEIFLNDVHDFVTQHNLENPDSKIEYNYERGSNSSVWASMLPTILMTGMFVAMMFYLYKRMGQTIQNENNHALSFGKAKIKLGKDLKSKTTFKDVAGCDEEKEELAEIVDFLKDPKSYTAMGARIPKGVLLVGPPGTGKTLLARAVAGEAGVPFFSISGSDFVEMYVGVGASRVRDLFERAKKNAPSILFIDEIDAVGRHRGAGMGGGHDEREQTLNQLLIEMDGFGPNEGVIIIAATNRPDILDPALLRPGRFDRQLTVGRPDIKGREEILRVHAKNKPLAPDVDLATIAKSTAGFTGADLENLLNEAALLAARRKKKAITMSEVEEATVKVVVGTEKKSHKISDKEKKLTAYHEAGHAVATYFTEGQDPVHEISIIPRGMAGGYTMHLPEEDKTYTSKNEMLGYLVVLLGGRVAESVVLGDISTGASNDLERATAMARDMVTRYGMSDKIGPVAYTSGDREVFLGKDYGSMKNYSEKVAADIDLEIKDILTNAYESCESIIREHKDKLAEVAEYLIVNEKADRKTFEAIMNGSFASSAADAETEEAQAKEESATEKEATEE